MFVKLDHVELTKTQIKKVIQLLPEVYSLMPVDILIYNDEQEAMEYAIHQEEIDSAKNKEMAGGFLYGLDRIDIYLYHFPYEYQNSCGILFILLHELRHVYQMYSDLKGYDENAFSNETLSIYHDEREVEIDADAFALSVMYNYEKEIKQILKIDTYGFDIITKSIDWIAKFAVA